MLSAVAQQQLPQPTVHVGNLDTSTPKRQLKEALFYRFARYGTVIDVVVMKRQKRLRGQAWVVFLSVGGASKCIQDAQGKLLLGRKMRLAYANKKSNATAERDGTWIPVRSRPKNAGADGKMNLGQQQGVQETSKETTKILLRDLPENATEDAMNALFGQFGQFLSLKQVEKDSMIVEFGTANAANVAYKNLTGFRLTPTDVLEMEFV